MNETKVVKIRTQNAKKVLIKDQVLKIRTPLEAVIIWSPQVQHSVKHTTASLKHTVASTSAFNADHPDVYDLATDDRTERITRPS